MKILFLSQGHTVEDQKGFDRAFATSSSRGVQTEMLNIPYKGYAEKHGWRGLYSEIVRMNDEFRPDVIFFQFFHGGKIESPLECVRQLRAKRHVPLIFGSQGDLFDTKFLGRWGRRPEKAMMELVSVADAFFSTSMGSLADYFVKHGAKNVVFLPHAFSEVHFPNIDDPPLQRKYDVVMLGSVGVSKRHPVGSFLHTHNRRSVAKDLYRIFGAKFGLFGKGWNGFAESSGAVAFDRQIDVFQSAKCVVDAPPPLNEIYYASDRPFFIAAAGVPLIQFYTPRFEKILADGENVAYVHSNEELVSVCEKILAEPFDEQQERLRGTVKLIRERHTQEKRVDTILSVAESLQNGNDGQLRFWHFLPNVDLNKEKKFAVVNWQIGKKR